MSIEPSVAACETGAPSAVSPPASAWRLLLVALPATVAPWLTACLLWPVTPGGVEVVGRLSAALGWLAVAALFCLAAGVEAVAHERLHTTAFDPLGTSGSRRLQVNGRYLQKHAGAVRAVRSRPARLRAIRADSGATFRAVRKTALTWIASRYAFWIDYHRSAAHRVLSVPGLIIPPLLLLFMVARFGYDQAGAIGAAALVLLYLASEAVLLRSTRPRPGPAVQS